MPILVLAVVLALAYWLMARGWKSRQRSFGDVAQPAAFTPLADAEIVDGPFPGTYVSSTIAGDWLNRVNVFGLGNRSRVRVTIGRGAMTLDREGARSLRIEGDALEAVRLDRGQAGKFVGKQGMLVITWRLDGTALDTGIRFERKADLAASAHLLQAQLEQKKTNAPEEPEPNQSGSTSAEDSDECHSPQNPNDSRQA